MVPAQSLARSRWIVVEGLRVVLAMTRLALAAVDTHTNRLPLDTGCPHAHQRAQFVLRELQVLSDTGIYSTLSLKSISDAATREGVFHRNTFLKLELASPYFSSGLKEEFFEVMVMEHFEDSHVSFAIDSFPDMDAGAMEDFYVQKVEQQRQTRNALFARLNRETEEQKRADAIELAVNLMLFSTDDLLSLAHAGGCSERDSLRTAAHGEIDRRWEQSAEGQLAGFSSSTLQGIAVDTNIDAEFRRLAQGELEHRLKTFHQAGEFDGLPAISTLASTGLAAL